MQLEHRLTSIEATVNTGFSQTQTAITSLTAEVGKQNGRVKVLEINEEIRRQQKRDRDWWLPLLVSIPPSVLALVTLLVVMGGTR